MIWFFGKAELELKLSELQWGLRVCTLSSQVMLIPLVHGQNFKHFELPGDASGPWTILPAL